MAKVAVLMVEGYEESETMQIVDLLRRAGAECHSFCFQEDPWVLSMQGMYVKSDRRFGPEVLGYDAIVVPGGRTAAAPLIANPEVMSTLKKMSDDGKLVCGMCSGTTVLEAAGVLSGRLVTGYTGYGEKLTSAAEFVADEVAVWDANIVTSQGPATPYPFAFKIIEALGLDKMPVCMAKTQYSLSDDASKLGRPRGFSVTVRELRVSAGAGFIVALTGDILTMPGLPKKPAAEAMDIDEAGRITGLF